MARETDYTVVYRAAADFSALAREAAKAKAILKAMREEEEKANKVSLRDQDAIEKARTRARKALEAQNMAATTSARISREMAERGKREAETVKELARNSEVAARQINKLAEAYKKLNGASSGDTTSNANRNITGNTSFAAVTARELEKVQKNLASYMASARSTTDTNTRLDNSMKSIKDTTAQYSDLLTRMSNAQKDAARGTTIITQETRKLGDVVETTTKKVHNAGTEAERIETTIRRVTKETQASGTAFQRWAGNVAASLRRTWKEADEGVGVFSKLRTAMSSDSNTSWGSRLSKTLTGIREQATHAAAALIHLPRAVQMAIGIAVIFEPAVAVLGSLGAAALGAANNLVYLAGSLAAIPGLIAAGATAVGALFVALKPAVGAIQQYSKALQESADNADKSAPKQRSNADAIRSAVRGVRTATESLADAQRAEKRAQEDLTQAWDDAKRSLEDLRDEVARGSLDEEAAVIRLARAKEEQLKVNGDIRSSDLDRREAALGVKEAEADLDDVRKRNKRNRDELTEAEKKGVANSEQVVRAQENLANAHRGVQNATLNLADAKAQLASASKVEASAATATMTQQNRYNRLLQELGPNTRKFVEYINGLRDSWKRIQRDTSEAFFKNIAGDTQKLNSLLPITSNLLTTAADALGRVAHRGIEMLASGPWKEDFKQLAKDNAVLIGNMGDAGLSVADAFRHITMAAAPFTKWVTSALKEGAANFAAWAKKAREDHSIQNFLDEAKERMQAMWRIAKNVGSALASWNTASSDFGKWMLERLEAMTKRWKENAKAQEESGSRLRTYLDDVKPVLTAVGSLVGAIAAGFADIASDPENIQGTVKLLTALEKDVLPPLLRFLDELNDSGIALTVAHALGTIFDAFSNFLEGGGGSAISWFVKSFAAVVDLFAEIASMPGVGLVLSSIAIGWAAVAGATLAAKFTGLFKLWEVLKWIGNSGKTVVNNLRGIGDAAAEAGQKTNTTVTTTTVPGGGAPAREYRPGAPIGTATSFSVVPNAELSEVKKNLGEFTKASGEATTKAGFFKRSLEGVKTAAGGMKRGLGDALGFLGGPWGAGIALATAAIIFATSQYEKHKQRVADTANAYKLLGDSYDAIRGGDKEQIESLIEQNSRFGDLLDTLKYYGLSTLQVSGAMKGQKQDLDAVNDAIDTRIAALENEIATGQKSRGENGLLINGLREMKTRINGAATEQERLNKVMADSNAAGRTWRDRLGGMTQTQVEGAQSAAVYGDKINALSGFLDTMASASSTAEERARALKDATDAIYGSQISANEASENWNRALINFSETAKRNHGDLRLTTKGGLETRDALEEAAKATRDETIALIASGTPYQDALKKHKDRIDALKEEARKAGLNKEETAKLIETYGKVPGEVKTDIKQSGFEKVYEDLKALQFAQYAIKNGLDPDDAAASFKRSQAAAKGQYPQGSGSGGLKPNTSRRAAGGMVWGEGTKTSDSIPAYLSHGEYVQKAASVDYYGQNLMHAMNNMAIKREALETAMSLSRGVKQKDDLDPTEGVARFAKGGFAQVPRIDQVDRISQPGQTWPFAVSLSGVTEMSRKLFAEWKKNYIPPGSGDGGSVSPNGMRSGILAILGNLRSHFGKVPLISGLRKGATTLSGNTSYHASGRAFDIGPVRAWAEYLKENYGSVLKELITPWRDLNMWQGRPHRYSRAIEAQHGVFGQNAHIHAAYRDGGLVNPLANMFNMGGLATPMPAMVGAPSGSPSGLSQAARSVVNNNSGMNFGDIIIHNPVPERGGDSIRSSVLRTAMLFDGP